VLVNSKEKVSAFENEICKEMNWNAVETYFMNSLDFIVKVNPDLMASVLINTKYSVFIFEIPKLEKGQ